MKSKGQGTSNFSLTFFRQDPAANPWPVLANRAGELSEALLHRLPFNIFFPLFTSAIIQKKLQMFASRTRLGLSNKNAAVANCRELRAKVEIVRFFAVWSGSGI